MPIHGRILIVDDDDGIRKILSMILRQAGHVVDTAANGEEGISKSNVNFYNLAILDVRLPDIEGTKLLTKNGENNSHRISGTRKYSGRNQPGS